MDRDALVDFDLIAPTLCYVEHDNTIVNPFEKECDNIRNVIVAFNIIVEKRVDIDLLNISSNVEEYNFKVSLDKELSQEEFDLLKEVTPRDYLGSN